MIFIGMNHPKHFWMFKNLIDYFNKRKIEYKVFVSSKDVLSDLLFYYNINYVLLGSNKQKIHLKILQLLLYTLKMIYFALKEKPKIFIGQALPHFALASFFFKKSSFLILEDTEHVNTLHKFTVPFCKYIYTPKRFPIKFNKKQISFNSFYELLYLHPKNFNPCIDEINSYGITNETKFIVIRLVSWHAHHDRGIIGLSDDFLSGIIKIFSLRNIKIIISTEGQINKKFEQYIMNFPPGLIHHILYFAEMYIGEGATMAAEASLLGTPSVYINPLNTSFCKELSEDYDLMYNFRNEKGVLAFIEELLTVNKYKDSVSSKLINLLNDKINPLPYFIKEIENLL